METTTNAELERAGVDTMTSTMIRHNRANNAVMPEGRQGRETQSAAAKDTGKQ